MRRTRVIPTLLLSNGGVYKTRLFKNPEYIGDPINAVRLFNDLEVDEIVVLGTDISKTNTSPDYDLISDIAAEAFVPLTYGGGITSVDVANRIMRSGVEKIAINHCVHHDKSIITRCAKLFGSQSVVVSIDYTKKMIAGLRQYDHVSKRTLKVTPLSAAIEADKLGAGEVLLNSVDRDGSMSGLDYDTIYSVSDSINIPVIACGGAGTLDHLKHAEEAGASAIAAGSMFVYHGKQRGILISYPNENILRKYLR